MEGSFTIKNPRQDITPAVADCWYRVPLTPRLPGDLSITLFICFVNQAKSIQKKERCQSSAPFIDASFFLLHIHRFIGINR